MVKAQEKNTHNKVRASNKTHFFKEKPTQLYKEELKAFVYVASDVRAQCASLVKLNIHNTRLKIIIK